ncbi:MAG TPA: hypothetical protein VHS06_07090, partial [Chloroflexota bacterium]|nr:hypothetical protein [Chloroflexota bacterium]
MSGAATPAPSGDDREAYPMPRPSEYQPYSFITVTQPPPQMVLLRRGTGGEDGGSPPRSGSISEALKTPLRGG